MSARGAALRFDKLLFKKAVALALLEPAPHKSVSFSAFDRYESDGMGCAGLPIPRGSHIHPTAFTLSQRQYFEAVPGTIASLIPSPAVGEVRMLAARSARLPHRLRKRRRGGSLSSLKSSKRQPFIMPATIIVSSLTFSGACSMPTQRV
jgi:hypothetical protein